MDGAAKVLGPIFAFALIGYGIYSWVNSNSGTLYAIAAGIVALLIGFYLFMNWSDNKAIASIYDGMPVEGPMKVNLRIEQIHPRKHRLHVDIKMTRKDWDALNATGLMNSVLFSYPHPEFEDTEKNFSVGLSLRVKYVDFTNAIDAIDAKEQCIQQLQALRSRIEEQHTFVARPAEHSEQLEI